MAESIATCNGCFVGELAKAATLDYATQPSTVVKVHFQNEADDHALEIQRDLPVNARQAMIADPTSVIDQVNATLKERKCDFVKTGKCAAAVLLVTAAFRRPI